VSKLEITMVNYQGISWADTLKMTIPKDVFAVTPKHINEATDKAQLDGLKLAFKHSKGVETGTKDQDVVKFSVELENGDTWTIQKGGPRQVIIRLFVINSQRLIMDHSIGIANITGNDMGSGE
jgi:hypothetical protein